MNLIAMRLLLFLLLFGLAFESVCGYVPDNSNKASTRKNSGRSNSKTDDIEMIQKIEEQMQKLNKTGDPARDKRALGILLQGFMEALGYTVSPIQYASIPNPGQMAGNASSGMMMMMPPMPPMQQNASASAPPRQRETVRITGVFNFGDSRNNSNLVNHLQQYEQLFHGNRSAPAAAPAAPAGPPAPAVPSSDIDPRSRPLLPEPLFVKIPLPIVPNLPPPQPPSPKPIHNTFRDEYSSKEHSEEFSNSKDDSGEHGDDEEEDDKSHYSEEYDHKHEQYDDDGPEDRNYESEGSHEGPHEPREKNVETEYKNNKNVENYQVENKELHHPSEVSEEVPMKKSKFNHAMFVDEPDWKEKQEAEVYKLAAEQEARAEALAEENAERDKDRTYEGEENEEYHRSREKEIDDKNEEREARYGDKSKVASHREEESSDEDDEEPGNHSAHEDEESDRDEASNSSEMPRSNSQRNEARVPNASDDYEEEGEEGKGNYHATLPITADREKLRQDQALRDSYGEILEKPGGKVDERVAGYFTMFKNPHTGIYDPGRIQDYESARINFDHADLLDGFNRIQKEYGLPENKYEEYEIGDDDDRVEHREQVDVPRVKSGKKASGSRGNQNKISAEASRPAGCNCDKISEAHSHQEAESPVNTVATLATGFPPLFGPVPAPPPQISYQPYYPAVNYLQDPLNYDQSIITRLTTYDQPPPKVRFEDRVDLIHNRSRTKLEKQQTVRPTTVALPERLTTMSWLHESEAKEIRAWPSPFEETDNYNANHRNGIFKKSPRLTGKASSNRASALPAPFKKAKPHCYDNVHTLPPGEDADQVYRLLKISGDERRNDNNNRRDSQRQPSASQRIRKVKPIHYQTTTIGYYTTLPTTQATIYEQRKRPSNNIEKPPNHNKRNRISITHLPIASESQTQYPDIISTTKKPSRSHHKNSRRTNHPKDNQQTIGNKPIANKKNISRPPPQKVIKSREESSNYVEKNGILYVPDPTPYNYNERIDEFTEEPESNTEKVKIKEYRNRIASVKSELKQLHPEGSMQIFKYTRHIR